MSLKVALSVRKCLYYWREKVTTFTQIFSSEWYLKGGRIKSSEKIAFFVLGPDPTVFPHHILNKPRQSWSSGPYVSPNFQFVFNGDKGRDFLDIEGKQLIRG